MDPNSFDKVFISQVHPEVKLPWNGSRLVIWINISILISRVDVKSVTISIKMIFKIFVK